MADHKAMNQVAAALLWLLLLLGSQQVHARNGCLACGPATNRKLHRKLHGATTPKTKGPVSLFIRRGAAVLTKVAACPGITPADVAKLVAKSKVKARIGAIPKAPTPQAAKFAGQTITMYIATQPLDGTKGRDVLQPIANALSKLAYCPFEGDHVLNLEVTLLSVESIAKRQYTATDKKILKCLNKIKVSMRAGHIEKIQAVKAAKAGPLVFPYVLAA